ncbi:hypothetical protein L226DRAFT_229882 [Lentinus tigrinus ALCF2SS1-7]|uniref:F-box domain-containing protein n=1 Tax=Lentinus tigrinus ALCF2SS1-6 TaxID=1328759 RepID=A0A5C2RU36_9APHY|nr:hypothetical protein L227DRAFT_314252 [Lentinus tigrinus ALCF2SS1-6]RPD70327.1 hypothetical protein L226DRAFT_229882 [Lentinus tigrinus ALCF2SS1-7]
MVSCLPLRKLVSRQKRTRRRESHEPHSLEPLEHAPHSPTCCLPRAASESVQLPVELWLEIIRHVSDAHVLAQLMRVNSTFHAATEPVLYHNVKLETDNAIVMFAQSLSWGPHRPRLIHGLTVSTLITIPHSLAARLEPLPNWGVKGCKAILSANYPSLRTFTSNLVAILVIPFVKRHTHIEELHLMGHPTLQSHTWPSGVTATHKLKLPSLRSLTCPPRFLDGALDIPAALTHLSLLPLDSNMLFLPSASPSFRSQLVSLRVRLIRFSRRPQALRPITLDDVVASFPKLKYLQVDMYYSSQPYELRTDALLHWTAKRNPDRHTTAAHRLTVAWIFPYPPERGVDLVRAAQWHQVMKEVALNVLLEWEHLVERIIFKHTIIPRVSVALNEYRTGLVCTQEWGMADNYWNTV